MVMTVVILNKPSNLLRGILRNALLEPQSNVFIGHLDRERIQQLVELIEKVGGDALLCVESKRSGFGMRLKVFGSMPKRKLVAMDGLQFVSKNKPK